MYASPKPTALLVDDDALSRIAQQSRLEGEGYTVLVASDRAEALARARQTAPNVIFVHLTSGSTGNVPLIQALRAEDACRHIPIMVLRDGNDSRVARTRLKSVPREAW